MKAAMYLRCSSIGQADGDSFDRQSSTIDRFAPIRNFTLVNCFFEAITGTSDDRPAFNAMLDWCVYNGVTHILIERMDRLARKFSVGETLIAMCQQRELTIIDCSTGETLTDDDPSPDAWLNASFRLMVAEWDKRNLVYRTGQARRRIRERAGKCEGRKGYSEVEEFRPAFNRVVELRKRGCKYREIATQMETEGWKTMYGGKWSTGTVQGILKGRQRQESA